MAGTWTTGKVAEAVNSCQFSLVTDTVEVEAEEQVGKSVTNNKWGDK